VEVFGSTPVTFALTRCHHQSVHNNKTESKAHDSLPRCSRRKASTSTAGDSGRSLGVNTSRRHTLDAAVMSQISAVGVATDGDEIHRIVNEARQVLGLPRPRRLRGDWR
jgi:hypothetical protein